MTATPIPDSAVTSIATTRPPQGGIGAGTRYPVHDSVESTLRRIARDMIDTHRLLTRLEVRNKTILAKGISRNGHSPVEVSCEIDENIADHIVVDDPATFDRLRAEFESRQLASL